MHFKLLRILLSVILILVIMSSCVTNKNTKSIDKTTIGDFDLNRYLGSWYEIARFDHKFERGMVGTKAEYSLEPNGMIKVVNSGYKGGFDGKYKEAIGKAKRANKDNPSMLKVSFFLWFYGEYNILELDKENYFYALIGSSTSEYLWILAREPKLSEDIKDKLLKSAQERGYDTTKLIWVEHK
jgi:lipocalin